MYMFERIVFEEIKRKVNINCLPVFTYFHVAEIENKKWRKKWEGNFI